MRHAVERIISDARRASDVIRRIRDLAKKATPEMVPIDVNGIIDDGLLLVQRQVINRAGWICSWNSSPDFRPCSGTGFSCSRWSST